VTQNSKQIAAGAGAFALLYVALYFVSGLIVGNQTLFGLVSLLFLPAFVRLLGFMILGFWIVPGLLAATGVLIATGAYDIAPGHDAEIIIGILTAIGGPLGAHFASRLIGLKVTLENLTSRRLLWMSIGCSLGNAVFYRLGLELAGIRMYSTPVATSVFIGDVVGTWVIIYLIKITLTALGRRL